VFFVYYYYFGIFTLIIKNIMSLSLATVTNLNSLLTDSNVSSDLTNVVNNVNINDTPLNQQHQNSQSQNNINNDIKLNRNLFTFKPKLNPKSEQLTQNIEGFYERQNKHIKKQHDLVSYC
jgi:hypothetical protein